MLLYFKQNCNDKYDSKIVYLKGKIYSFSDKRGREILHNLEGIVEEVQRKSVKASKTMLGCLADDELKQNKEADEA